MEMATMVEASGLSGLANMLRAATGPDRELDSRICLAFQEPNEHYKEPWRKPILLASEHRRPGLLEYVEISGVSARSAPLYTSSLDAAVALARRLLPGCDLDIEMREAMANGRVYEPTDVRLSVAYQDWDGRGEADSPPLAVCLAVVLAVQRRRASPSSERKLEGGE